MTRILILWLLSEGPMHGYRVQKVLRAPAFAFWFRIEDAAIYSMLRSLVKGGFARLEGAEQVGKRPQRTLYRITRQGRAELGARIGAAWRRPERDRDPVAAALAAADELEAGETRVLLADRKAALRDRLERLRDLERSAPSGLLARREAALLRGELGWIDWELKHLRNDEEATP